MECQKSGWIAFKQATSLGQKGSEGGIILRDDEYERGARITLEQDCQAAPFAITCGIYGWMVHTCFFSTLACAETAYLQMQEALAAVVAIIPYEGDSGFNSKMQQVAAAISQFVERFP